MATGVLRRLSVAVVIDNQHLLQEDGSSISQAYSEEAINRFAALVKQAVGFDNHRGDQVTVTNVAFRTPEVLEALPDLPVWEQPWFMDAVKQLAGVLVVLFLVFGVLRPTMRGLVRHEEAEKTAQAAGNDAEVSYDENGVPVAVPAGATGDVDYKSMETEDLLLLEAPQSYEKRLEYVQKLVDDDPKLVAQVVKTWVVDNG